jgi:hypothetical protein
MREDVKFKFISLFGVAAQKLDMEIVYIKAIIKTYVINQNKMLRDAWNAPNAIHHIP